MSRQQHQFGGRWLIGSTVDHGYARYRDEPMRHAVVVALPAEGLEIRRPIDARHPMIMLEFSPDGARAIAKALRKAARDSEPTP